MRPTDDSLTIIEHMDAKIFLVDDEPMVTDVMKRYVKKGDLPRNSPRWDGSPEHLCDADGV